VAKLALLERQAAGEGGRAGGDFDRFQEEVRGFWPADEAADAFNAAIRALRREGAREGQRE
jgi:hypothetical protein